MRGQYFFRLFFLSFSVWSLVSFCSAADAEVVTSTAAFAKRMRVARDLAATPLDEPVPTKVWSGTDATKEVCVSPVVLTVLSGLYPDTALNNGMVTALLAQWALECKHNCSEFLDEDESFGDVSVPVLMALREQGSSADCTQEYATFILALSALEGRPSDVTPNSGEALPSQVDHTSKTSPLAVIEYLATDKHLPEAIIFLSHVYNLLVAGGHGGWPHIDELEGWCKEFCAVDAGLETEKVALDAVLQASAQHYLEIYGGTLQS